MRELAVDFLACGLDPARAVFFRQSAVPEVNELAWILSTVCPMSLLAKCHSYKDKTAQGIAPNHGLFAYPVLMAADILLYDSNQVPVGKDQKQHLEVTRDLAVKLNETYGEGTVVLPDPIIREDTAVVVGLDGRKMSKSYGNTLPIFGEEKPLKKLIMKITTDSTPVEEPKPTENSTILALYKLFASACRLRGDGGGPRARWHRLRGFQEAPGGCLLGIFRPDAGAPGGDTGGPRICRSECLPQVPRGLARRRPRCSTGCAARWDFA